MACDAKVSPASMSLLFLSKVLWAFLRLAGVVEGTCGFSAGFLTSGFCCGWRVAARLAFMAQRF